MATPRPHENTAPTTESRLPLQGTKPPGWLGGVQQFYHDVGLEMKKVSWPTKTEVINTTMVVVIAVFFFAFFLFGTDVALTYVIKFLEAGAKRLFG